MQTLFVDSSYIIALVNERDAYHEQALQLAVRYANYPLMTTDAVMLESGNTLSRRKRQKLVGSYTVKQTRDQ